MTCPSVNVSSHTWSVRFGISGAALIILDVISVSIDVLDSDREVPGIKLINELKETRSIGYWHAFTQVINPYKASFW